MSKWTQILVRTLVLGVVAVNLLACGQQGPLYLPTHPAAANRASLPDALLPATDAASRPKPVQTP
ncbi:lipoprotein [Rhodoferax sp.]|uniref:LPS translocon maturation chaperone LptM n=1 Tax=Rhodoferax sp. TaxID=50421 RepID=UPI00262F24A0|nr:lipoprotein [Rhodoferax sp.]